MFSIKEKQKKIKRGILMNFIKLLGTCFRYVFRNIHKVVGILLVLSLIAAFVTWFVSDVLFENKIGFLIYWKLWFLIMAGLVFIYDYIIVLLVRTLASYTLLKEFKTTTNKISKAILKYDLLKDKKMLNGNAEDFEDWFSKMEFSEKLGNIITKAFFK